MKVFSKQSFVVVVYPNEVDVVDRIRDRIGNEAMREMWSDEMKGYCLSAMGAISFGLVTSNEAMELTGREYTFLREK